MKRGRGIFLSLVMVIAVAIVAIIRPVLAEQTDKQFLGELSNVRSGNKVTKGEQRQQNEKQLTTIQSTPGTSTDFSFKLFDSVASGSKENVLVSPFSAYVALSMTLNGAAGSTGVQMAKTLGINLEAINSLNQRNKAVLAQLVRNSDKVKLEIANAIFSDTDTPFKNSFIEKCKQLYDAEIKNVDFHNEKTVKDINNWCYTKTYGKIPTIIDKLERDEKMFILNAVYFKGNWESPFKKDATESDKFLSLAGDVTDVQMMHQRERLSYMKGSDFQAVSIPYAGQHQSMYIFLPDKQISFPLFQAQFTEDNWNQWMPKFHSVDINLSLPKFTVEFKKDLSSVLKALGMAEAFDRSLANFSNMITPPWKAWISRVLQKTYMEVNEEGTEAAAVTAVGMSACCMVPPPPIEFRVDHSFVLSLVDNDTKEILFLGSITQPQ